MKLKIKKNIKILSLYILSFFLLFTPDLGHISFFLNPSIIIICTSAFFVLFLNKKILYFIKKNHLCFLSVGIICVSFLAILRSTYGGQKGEYILYICLILQIINFVSIIIVLSGIGYDQKQLYGFIVKCFLIQAIIICFMYQSSELKSIANNLYFVNLKVKDIKPFIGIEEFRIYGITGDYTYATPIAMAYIAIVAFILAIFYNLKRYYLYFALLLATSFLNGRTGIMLAFLAIFITTLIYFITNMHSFNKMFLVVLFLGILLTAFMMFFIAFSNSVWAVWVRSGFLEIKNFFINKEKSGNLAELLDNMIFFPEGWYRVIGYGRNVFVEDANFMEGRHSDIGYINDAFRGGAIYIALLYIPVFHFILQKNYKKYRNKKMWNILKYISFIFIIVANYKGECMNSNTIFNTILYICIISGPIILNEKTILGEEGSNYDHYKNTI